MSNLKRRDFIKLTGAVAATTAIVGTPCIARGKSKKVVVVGGGTGGSTAAKYVRMADPTIEVTLVEPNDYYHSCYLSNEVLSGKRDVASLRFGYEGLERHGVKVVRDTVTGMDANARRVMTKGGMTLSYDRAIVSPGVDFKWEAIEGYDATVAERIPHAWKAGAQTTLLRDQIRAMRDGGVVIIVAPPNPFRCPPGPYERASQIAMYLQRHKPKSKVLILDPKDKFSKFGLFKQAWKKLYGFGTDDSLITWMGGADGGGVSALNAKSMTLIAELEEFEGDVINVIPPQKAGKIAFDAGLTQGDWCPVNKKTFESTRQPGIYVIGDASIATKMPKSAYAANSQAKVAASAVVDVLNEREPGVASYVNTCYSIVGEQYGFSVAAVYRLSENGKTIVGVKGAGGLTPMDASEETLAREVNYAYSWFDNITQDSFG